MGNVHESVRPLVEAALEREKLALKIHEDFPEDTPDAEEVRRWSKLKASEARAEAEELKRLRIER